MITRHNLDLEIMVHQIHIKQAANLKLLTFISSNTNHLQKSMSYSVAFSQNQWCRTNGSRTIENSTTEKIYENKWKINFTEFVKIPFFFSFFFHCCLCNENFFYVNLQSIWRKFLNKRCFAYILFQMPHLISRKIQKSYI